MDKLIINLMRVYKKSSNKVKNNSSVITYVFTKSSKLGAF